jgi:hypothetical protein
MRRFHSNRAVALIVGGLLTSFLEFGAFDAGSTDCYVKKYHKVCKAPPSDNPCKWSYPCTPGMSLCGNRYDSITLSDCVLKETKKGSAGCDSTNVPCILKTECGCEFVDIHALFPYMCSMTNWVKQGSAAEKKPNGVPCP